MRKELTISAVYLAGIITAIVLVPSARLGLSVGLAMGLFVAIMVSIHAARYRLPTEGWLHWYRRIMFSGWKKGRKYYYCLLDCRHHVQILSSRVPRRGEVVWCPAHHRTHAFQAQVELVNAYAVRGEKTVTGAVLDEDLLAEWGEDAQITE